MDTSINQLTFLLFRHGAIQTSPEHVAILNAQGYIPFVDTTIEQQTSSSGYKVLMTGYANFILEKETSTGEKRNLLSLLKGLRAIPRPLQAKILKGSISTFQLSNDSYRVDYRVTGGQVVVYNIQPLDRIQIQRDKQEQVALYKVKRNARGIWQTSNQVDKVTTRYAAVNGQSNNLTKATWLMGSHLEYEFKSLQEYTLFHNPSIGSVGDSWESFRDKMGFTTPVTKKFAKILAETQAAGNETKWVTHSQGGAIFAEGVRYILNDNSHSALHQFRLNGLRNPEKGELLNKQSVAFHANANNNLRSKPLLKRAGINVIAIRANDYDMVPNVLGLNTLNPRKLIGSMVYMSHVLNGSVTQSPHTLMQDQATWNNNMDYGPGKGRDPVQKVFNTLVKPLNNYLP
ncbi:MAG: hypothetical protein WCY88_17360 [Spongiibacteraceae bacterium]